MNQPSRLAIAEDAIHAAVAERDVPLVAIPSSRPARPARPACSCPSDVSPPVSRRPPRARRAAGHRAAGEAAAIGRHAHRPAAASTATRAGTGWRQRRKRGGHGLEARDSGLGGTPIALEARPVPRSVRAIADRARWQTASSRTHPGRYESTSRRRADAVLPHQRAEPREQRRQLLGRRMRAREQRVLQRRGPASDR